jgi:putative oxidoreductase
MELNRSIAVLIIRMLLGLIFLMQGFGKVFTFGVENVYNADFFYGTYKDLLPGLIIKVTAYYTSYIELIGGLLLILGLKTSYTLFALSSVLIIVTFGHGLAEPIWDLSHVMWRAIPLVSLLLLPKQWDKFSMDHIITKYTTTNKK